MKAGREIDALVADKVMGKHIMRWMHLPKDDCVDIATGKPPLAYSTDIAAAWTVSEKLQSDGWTCKLESAIGTAPLSGLQGKTYHMAAFQKDYKFIHEYANTAPLAICLAALKAVGEEIRIEE